MPKKSSRKSTKKSSKKSTKKSSRKSTKKTPKKASTKKTPKKTSGKNLVMSDDCRYKGKEPSPKGYGYCAHLQYKGVAAEGTDGNTWIVAERKNGSLYWKKM